MSTQHIPQQLQVSKDQVCLSKSDAIPLHSYIVLCQDDSNPPHFKIVERDSHTFLVEVGILPAFFLRRSSSTAIWPS
ncbi:hypothetical protein PCANC_04889 [Puccinia coronata f. sp. avenae]|uniref:Uncharacterized protein n=1 Tax=Puccinia coronata f. sp. avenae TaxID=200324 RepID=A0A2N5VWK0_9BASI|nr:hypothetical protein PCANC_04889 [Puccinia coronata f. sp. avenae]